MNRAVCAVSKTRTPAQSTPCSVSQARYSAKSEPAAATSFGAPPRAPDRVGDVPADTAAADDEVLDEEAQREVFELVGEQLLGELARELHQMVGRQRPAHRNSHAGHGTERLTGDTKGAVDACRGRPPPLSGWVCSVERVAAGAAARRIGVVDGEPLLLDGVDEVDGRALHVWRAHAVDGQPDAAEITTTSPSSERSSKKSW